MKTIIRWLGLAATVGVALFVLAAVTSAQGFGNNPATLWKVVSGALQPVSDTWTIGSASNRVDGVYTDLIDASSVVIGGSVSGNLSVGGYVSSSDMGTEDSTATTSTLRVTNDGETKKGCLVIGDSDGAGVTYCRAADGALTCSTTSCK